MNGVDTRAPFFPGKTTGRPEIQKRPLDDVKIQRNEPERIAELNKIQEKNAKVDIPEKIKDFAKIKSLSNQAVPVDNSDKIARLKSQIADGSYNIDYEAVADKILQDEFNMPR
jgi:negative regulator of flagellin synthesis FlgM